MVLKQVVEVLLMTLGAASVAESLTAWLGWWVGIQYSSKNSERPGWYRFRPLPREYEYKPLKKE